MAERGIHRDLYQARQRMRDYVDTLIDVGRILGSQLGESMNSVLVDILGIETVPGTDRGERANKRVLFGVAGVLMRPADPTAEGSCEVAFVRGGDDMLAVATRDPRWQIALEKGDAALRSMSDTQSYVHVKADGDIDAKVSAVMSVFGSTSDAADFLAQASKVNERINAIHRALDALAGATVAPNDGGASLQTALKGAWPAASPAPGVPTADADVGATKVKGE